MKKVFFVITITLLSLTNGYSQTINNIALKDLDVEYIEIVGRIRPLSSKLAIGLDYGQERSLMDSYINTKLKDANGKDLVFNYMIEALNFMTKNGFEFVQAYSSMESDESVYHYLLKKSR